MTSDHDRGGALDLPVHRDLARAVSSISRACQDLARAWQSTVRGAVRFLSTLAKAESAEVREARALLAQAEVRRLIADREALALAVEVKVSGAEAAYYMRTGLGTWIYRNDAAVGVLVKRTMRATPEDPDDPVQGMTIQHRARLAASAIRGYVEAGAGVP